MRGSSKNGYPRWAAGATASRGVIALAALLVLPPVALRGQPRDPLPSWNDSAAKRAMVAFVDRVTKDGSPDFVEPAERIATFDNDGTLWAEQPIYLDRRVPGDRR